MRALRRQPREEVDKKEIKSPDLIKKPIAEKKKAKVIKREEEPAVAKSSLDKESSLNSNVKGMSELELRVKQLEAENKMLKGINEPLSKNEEKLLTAIRTEVIIQKKSSPVVGRKKLQKTYKINPRYLDEAIKGLSSKGYVRRKKVKYAGNIETSQWEILEN